MSIPIIKPPFDFETATAKVKVAENTWNTRDPERVVLAYTEDSEWRNRTEFLHGRKEIKAFLYRKWEKRIRLQTPQRIVGFPRKSNGGAL